MRKIMMMIMGVVLMALPTMAQTFGTKYAERPSVVFQSTSTMIGSGSTYSANPTLNTDGTATYNGASASAPSASGPRRMKMDGFGDNQDNPTDPQPLGDAVLPLLLMSLAFGMFVYFRRKQTLNS